MDCIEQIELDIDNFREEIKDAYLTIPEINDLMDDCQKLFKRLIDWLKNQIDKGGDAEDYNSICIDYIRDYKILNNINDDLYLEIQFIREGV